MADRLTKIYTRTGDDGFTGLADGSRILKDNILIHAQGDIDELNSFVGLLACRLSDDDIRQLLFTIQQHLFELGAEVSMSEPFITPDMVAFLEQHIDSYNHELEPLREFILPGGGEAASTCHVTRAVCRRCERSLIACYDENAIGAPLLAYINRLSDLLFVLARTITRLEGGSETYWNSGRIESSEQ